MYENDIDEKSISNFIISFFDLLFMFIGDLIEDIFLN